MLYLNLRRTHLVILLLAVFVLGSSGAASALEQPVPGRRANARKLLRIADGATHRLIQAGQGRLDRDARSRPFWEALLRMDAQLDRVGAGIRTRDVSFFQTLRSGTASLAELRVIWALTGLKDPAVEQNLRTLSAAYDRLRNRYGPEWVRFQTGRPLSEDERLRFARMRAEQGLLADRIQPLRDQAERDGDYATADELSLLLAQIHAVAGASSTLGDYLDASVATDAIRGAWFGARATHSAEEEGWAAADQVVSDIATDENVGFVFSTDLESVQGWSFVEEETEIPAEIARTEERGSEDVEVAEEAGIEEIGSGEAVEVPDVMVLDETSLGESEIWEEEPGEEGAEEEEPAVEVLDELPEDVSGEEAGETVETTLEDTEGIDDIQEVGGPIPEAVPVDGAIEEEDIEIEDVAPPPTGLPIG
jgi:hypothetical protein